MSVVFEDVKRETYIRTTNVIEILSDYDRIDKRKIWTLIFTDGHKEDYPHSQYKLYRVES